MAYLNIHQRGVKFVINDKELISDTYFFAKYCQSSTDPRLLSYWIMKWLNLTLYIPSYIAATKMMGNHYVYKNVCYLQIQSVEYCLLNLL